MGVTLAVSADSVRLNESKQYPVTVSPAGGFSGTVTLAVTGLPTGVTATFAPATVTVAGQPVTSQLTLSVPSSATITSGPVMLSITASDGTQSASFAFALTIPAELLLTIPKGVNIGSAASPNPMAFGAATLTAHYVAGMKITFLNLDTIAHRIHSDGVMGIAHEPSNLTPAGGTYTQTLVAPGTIKANELHCHVHPNGMIGPQITVMP
jgi:plastocyanin